MSVIKRISKTQKGWKAVLFLGLLALLSIGTSLTVQARGKAPSPKKASVIFYENDGSRVIEVKETSKGWMRLPIMKNTETRTFMGWSSTPGQQTSPQYQPGDVITVKKKTRLYAVMYKRRREPNLDAATLPMPDPKKYSKVIFVGDSRTNMLMNRMKEEATPAQMERLAFVARSGQGLSWFKKTGIELLLTEVRAARKQYPGQKVAVIFNLGVNDLRTRYGIKPSCKQVSKDYIEYMNKIGKTLQRKGCRLFYMSVNPINGAMTYEENIRRTEEVRYLNRQLQKKLDKEFTFLNCYDYLMGMGYSTGKSYADPNYRDDGVHYTPMTYKRIYKYCINKINKY